MAKKRKLCTFPMSQFYIYEDDIPDGVRVSTTNDCIECHASMNDDYCDATHCLIEEVESIPLPHPNPDE